MMFYTKHLNHQVLELKRFNQMPRKKKTNGDQPIGIGLTPKQMKRKKPIGNSYLLDIEPITDNQKKLFDSYAEGKHLLHMVLQVQEKHSFPYIMHLLMYQMRQHHTKESILCVLQYQLVKLVFYQAITRIKQIFTKYHTKIW